MTRPILGEPIPLGTVTALKEDPHPSAPPETAENAPADWNELVAIGWNIAFLPALTWSSFVTASWEAWGSALQPKSFASSISAGSPTL